MIADAGDGPYLRAVPQEHDNNAGAALGTLTVVEIFDHRQRSLTGVCATHMPMLSLSNTTTKFVVIAH